MTADLAIEGYVDQVAAALPGPARERGDMMAELRAGLLDALDARRRDGLPDDAAVAAATAEFGEPRVIAATFRSELAARLARRCALTLAGTGPVVGLLWTAAAMASHVGMPHALPWEAGAPGGSTAVVRILLVALLVTVGGALVTIVATGRLAARWAGRPRVAPAAAAVSGYGAVIVDVAIFTLLASQLASAPGGLAPLPVAGAALASVARLLLAWHAAQRCRAALA
ncbi:MAG TPA: permease prefix domain 1-containing protein [Streptosporangiaceae bacterium]|nr:permease prefix domain 1-containing protein [Streptosporangiaceae bacterium]